MGHGGGDHAGMDHSKMNHGDMKGTDHSKWSVKPTMARYGMVVVITQKWIIQK